MIQKFQINILHGTSVQVVLSLYIQLILPNPLGPSTGCDPCTAPVVSVIFVVYSLGVLAASVLCYISKRCKKSYKPSSHADPVYDEVGTIKKMNADVMEMNTNTAYGSHIMEMNTNTAYGSHMMEMNTNTACGSHIMEMNTNTAYGSHIWWRWIQTLHMARIWWRWIQTLHVAHILWRWIQTLPMACTSEPADIVISSQCNSGTVISCYTCNSCFSCLYSLLPILILMTH